jgi:ABC-type transport system substrate-binding protein
MESQMAKGQSAEQYQEPKPIGSGPFRMVSFNLQDQVVLEANEKHWAAPKMARWILRVVTNNDAALGMLQRGEINFLTDYRGDPKVLVDMAKQDRRSRWCPPPTGFRLLAPNAVASQEAIRRSGVRCHWRPTGRCSRQRRGTASPSRPIRWWRRR